jgi:hypothetical protein
MWYYTVNETLTIVKKHMNLLKKIFGTKKYSCEKCKKEWDKSEGNFILRNKNRFCCKNCCKEPKTKEASNKKEVCEFC